MTRLPWTASAAPVLARSAACAGSSSPAVSGSSAAGSHRRAAVRRPARSPCRQASACRARSRGGTPDRAASVANVGVPSAAGGPAGQVGVRVEGQAGVSGQARRQLPRPAGGVRGQLDQVLAEAGAPRRRIHRKRGRRPGPRRRHRHGRDRRQWHRRAERRPGVHARVTVRLAVSCRRPRVGAGRRPGRRAVRRAAPTGPDPGQHLIPGPAAQQEAGRTGRRRAHRR